MIRRWLRGLIREEMREFEKRWIDAVAETIGENNQALEDDLVRLGVLERGEDGELRQRDASGS